MLCGQLKELLMEAALDEAGVEERKRVEAHLAACEACRKAFVELRLTRKLLLQALPQEEPPQRLRFVSERGGAWGWRGWIWQRAFAVPVGIAAAIALLAGVFALTGARAEVSRGQWQAAFGAPRVASQPAAQALDREQVARIVAAAVRQSEQRRRADTAASVEAAIGKLDQREQAAFRDLLAQVAYLDRKQTMLYKQGESTQSRLEMVAKQLPAEREGQQ